jgi:hypothetical protein
VRRLLGSKVQGKSRRGTQGYGSHWVMVLNAKSRMDPTGTLGPVIANHQCSFPPPPTPHPPPAPPPSPPPCTGLRVMGAMTWRPSTRLPSDTSQATMVPSAPPGGGGGGGTQHSTVRQRQGVVAESHTTEWGVTLCCLQSCVCANSNPGRALTAIGLHRETLCGDGQAQPGTTALMLKE